MTRTGRTLLALAVLLAPIASVALGQETDPTALVSSLADRSISSTSESAFLSLRRTLRKGSPSTIQSVQQALCRQLVAADAVTMRRICLTLAIAPCDEAVVLVVDRLQAATPEAMRSAACQSLRHLVSHQQPVSPKTTSLALSRLAGIARDRQAPPLLVDEAILGLGAFRSTGFDTLAGLRGEPTTAGQIGNVFYTAISDTGDPRALPLLREAVMDTKSGEGLRSQAVNAIGRLFDSARRRGLTIDPAERAACSGTLYQYLGDDTPDQLFAVAIKSLARITPVDQDAGLQQAIGGALSSPVDIRREAALDALYQSRSLTDTATLETVRSLAKSDDNNSIRETAAAVIEQNESTTGSAVPTDR